MSLLKRLNTTGMTVLDGPAVATPPNVATGELFRPSTTPVPPPNPGSAADLFSQSRPLRGTSPIAESAPPAARSRQGKPDGFNELKARVQNRLIAELDPRMDLGNAEEVRRTVEETFASVLEAEGITLTRVERLRLFEAISAEILGYGPIEPLLKDPAINEIGRASCRERV